MRRSPGLSEYVPHELAVQVGGGRGRVRGYIEYIGALIRQQSESTWRSGYIHQDTAAGKESWYGQSYGTPAKDGIPWDQWLVFFFSQSEEDQETIGAHNGHCPP